MINEKDYIIATYLVHGNVNFTKKAQNIAIGLTVGTWTELPKAKQKEMEPFLGRVVDVKELRADVSGIPRAVITIGYPILNLQPDLPSILTTVFGKLSMDGQVKLIDLHLPDSYLKQFPGPRFGIQGIRNQLQIENRPLLMSIFKQCIGLSLDELDMAYQDQIAGGVDLVKDDEIYINDKNAPVIERIKMLENRNLDLYDRTGKKVLYAVNLTGPVTQLLENAKRYVDAGASSILLNVLPYGFDILHRLASDSNINVPIIAHPSFAGAVYPSIRYGVSPVLLLGKLLRWTGADIVLYPSPYGSVSMPMEDAVETAKSLRTENKFHYSSFPVPSAGIYPGLVPEIYRCFGNDIIVNAGGGIHGHPQGSTAGAKAFKDAIDAVISERPLEEAAVNSIELQIALDKWGVYRL